MPKPHHLTSAEVAAALGKDVRTVHRWVQRGVITPDVTVPGYRGAHLFTAEEVDRVRAERARVSARREQVAS